LKIFYNTVGVGSNNLITTDWKIIGGRIIKLWYPLLKFIIGTYLKTYRMYTHYSTVTKLNLKIRASR